MIFPRGRTQIHRYQRHKVVAILVTFAVLWIVLKLLPEGSLFGNLADSPPPTPQEAFRDRESGVTVSAEALVEKVMTDSLAPGGRSLRRWRVRSPDGHPFTVLQDGYVRAAVGDTVRVTGVYRWDTSGGTVRMAVEDGGEGG